MTNNTDSSKGGRLGASDGRSEIASVGDKQVVKRSDIAVIAQIGELLNEFYPDVRKAILEYCLFITEKDLEG
jgi:hypothetical protein